ncbi:MAG: SseB family protein [Oscillospiraceae bacterium]|nr:SseB family protein [Oscillospiraceae bacterium]MBR2977237.1 SseB family protein [Oscillospiraceae bacterium]MBR3849819.1 SseB family protein [Oscillospiraceae bacterium]
MNTSNTTNRGLGPKFDFRPFEAAIHEQDADTLHAILTEAIREHAWLYFPVGKDNGAPMITKHAEDVYVIAFTSMAHYRKRGENQSIAAMNIEKMLNFLYSVDDVDGIVFNPFTEGFGMRTSWITPLIAAAREGSWGEGIPENYEMCDIVQPDEFLMAGVSTFAEEILPREGYEPILLNIEDPDFPTIVATKDGERFHFLVQAIGATELPQIDEETKQKALKAAQEDGARCMYAALCFASHDNDRFAFGLMLRGDRYRHRFTGFQEIK